MKPKKPIESIILTLRGQKVILDADLAELYGVPVKRLNEQVKRNIDRFPEDFVFLLTEKEAQAVRAQVVTTPEAAYNESDVSMWSQTVTTSPEVTPNEADTPMWSQIATTSSEVPAKEEDTKDRSQSAASDQRRRRPQFRPYAFTEHGAIMAATVLNSTEAVAMSLYVVRAFVQMRGVLAANAEILKRLAEIDQTLLEHDTALRDVYQKLLPLLSPPPEKPKRRIGFHSNPGEAQTGKI